jgi:hypothetical protein
MCHTKQQPNTVHERETTRENMARESNGEHERYCDSHKVCPPLGSTICSLTFKSKPHRPFAEVHDHRAVHQKDVRIEWSESEVPTDVKIPPQETMSTHTFTNLEVCSAANSKPTP